MNKLLKSPWLELIVMCGVVILSYIALMLISIGAETPPGGMSLNNISLLTFGFFLLSFAIAAIAVLAGRLEVEFYSPPLCWLSHRLIV